VTVTVPPRSVPPSKLTDYLLRPDHPVGGSKAAFFQAFGFSLDRPDIITAAFIAHPDRNPVADTEHSRWGVKYTVRCRVRTPDGRDPCILTVWIVPTGERGARLVTAYPDDGR
jgi:filamentous hemagglutinin